LRSLASAWRVEFLALSGHLDDARREAEAAGVATAAGARGRPEIQWRVRLASTLAIATMFAASGETARALQLLESARMEYEAAGLILPAWRLEVLAIAVLKQRGATEEAIARLQEMLDCVVREGALGLLLEYGSALESLLHAVQHRNRELLLSGAQRNAIAETLARLRKDNRTDHEVFSSRELDVLRELCEGRSNKAIGRLLDLSENTVKFHLKRIFRKLGADSRSAAIAAAVQRNLVRPGDGTKRG
jgi:LuxR family maltose regulon positive regulatory protein